SQLGMPSGVLAPGADTSQSLDRVLLRLSIEDCRNMAAALPAPAAAASPNDPAAYKPQTEFDNTPWRIDMSQNGKRMTADEFDAWMKARGVRVARGAAPAAAPAAASTQPTAVAANDLGGWARARDRAASSAGPGQALLLRASAMDWPGCFPRQVCARAARQRAGSRPAACSCTAASCLIPNIRS